MIQIKMVAKMRNFLQYNKIHNSRAIKVQKLVLFHYTTLYYYYKKITSQLLPQTSFPEMKNKLPPFLPFEKNLNALLVETNFDHLIFFPCIAQVSRFGQNLFSCIISYYVMHPIYDVSTGKLDRFDAFTKLKILKLITCNSKVSILMNLILDVMIQR